MIIKHTARVLESIKQALDSADVIKAYPNTYKPTRMTKPVVAISPYMLEQKPIGFGEYGRDVDITVCVEVFVPYSMGIDHMNSILDTILQLDITGKATCVKLGTPSSNKLMDCIQVQLLLGYNDYIGD